jgi:hypothetical protein
MKGVLLNLIHIERTETRTKTNFDTIRNRKRLVWLFCKMAEQLVSEFQLNQNYNFGSETTVLTYIISPTLPHFFRFYSNFFTLFCSDLNFLSVLILYFCLFWFVSVPLCNGQKFIVSRNKPNITETAWYFG